MASGGSPLSPSGALVGMEGEPLDPFERPLDGRPMEPQPFGQLGKGGFGRLAASVRDEPDDVGLLREPAVSVELPDRREVPAGRADGSLEICRLRVQDPIQVAAQRPRHLPRLELEECAAGPDPAKEQPDGIAALPRHHAPAAPDAPRCRQPDVAQPLGQRHGLVRVDDELEMRPTARQAEGPAGQEEPAQIGHPAVLGGGRPIERLGRAQVGGIPRRSPATGSAPTQPDRQPRDGALPGRRRRRETRRLGAAIARPRGIDRRELRPEGGDEVAFGAGHSLRPSGRRRPIVGASRSHARTAGRPRPPAAPGHGGDRSPGRRRRRGRAWAARRPPAASAA